MPQGTLIWLLVLLVLVLLFVVVVRRMSVLVGRTRDLERFQRQVASLEERLAVTADPFAGRLDEIRRRSGDPKALGEGLPAAQGILMALAAEGRTLKSPPLLRTQSSAFVTELERAVRAAELVEHGLDALLADRGGRDLEAQTSLKRGALNLRHAREAATRVANEIAGVRPGDLLPRPDGQPRPSAPAGTATYLVDVDSDTEGR